MFAQLIVIMIKNLLHFLEYFDDKIDSMKNFPLGFEEVRSINLSCFSAQMQKDWNEKMYKNSLPSWILSCGQQV